MPEKNDYYDEAIKYNYKQSTIDEMETLFNDLHNYLEQSKTINNENLEEIGNLACESLIQYIKLYNEIIAQYQYSKIQYDIKQNKENADRYDQLTKIYNEYEKQYCEIIYQLSQSNLKQYTLEKYSEDYLKKIEKEYNSRLNLELQKLLDKEVELEIQAKEIKDIFTSNEVLKVYNQIIQNNNQIAKLYNYDSYIEYAYENYYYRDYSYQESLLYCEKVKQYISPLFEKTYNEYMQLVDNNSLSNKEYDYYLGVLSESFFENQITNTLVNDYMTLINDENKLNFSEEFISLFASGNYFIGEYEGAYEWNIKYLGTPILYFGSDGYSSSFTIVHEFGHYMNDLIYNNHESYDLLECHSQGNELLYLSYLETVIPKNSFELIEKYQILKMMERILLSAAINIFEIAVYNNYYTATDCNLYLSDNKITYNEYDDLFKSILKWFNIDNLGYEQYWRNLVDFNQCYYISYSVSAVAALQIYAKSVTDGFDDAMNSYLKLFNYYDIYKEYTFDQILEYAGLYSFNNDKAFELITNIY